MMNHYVLVIYVGIITYLYTKLIAGFSQSILIKDAPGLSAKVNLKRQNMKCPH